MEIGAWGTITFRVRKKDIVLLSGLKETSSSNIASHKTMATKTRYQWINYEAESLSLKLVFDSMVCKKPFDQYMALKDLEGKMSPLVIGGKRIGYHDWMLQEITGDISRIILNGKISRIEVNCKFVEYYDG